MEPFNFEKIPEVLRQLFEKVERLETLIAKLIPSEYDDVSPMSVKEAADFLQITVPSLYAKVSRREIPVNKPGRRLYFDKKELHRWVLSGKKKTMVELKADSDLHLKKKKIHRY